jgi:alpha-ketoglutarate-dependent taurine dioxygenase
MAYTDNPPDALAFFCEIPAEAGGETTVADARLVTSRLDRSVLARFEAKGVGIRRTLPTPESLAKKPGIPKAWTDVFETTDRDEVERIARDRGWTVSWLPDNSVQLWQALLPGFRSHPRTGERVWFNQVHYHSPECTLRWAERDGRLDQVAQIKQAIVDYPEMLDYAFHSDGTRVSADDANHIWDVIEQSEIPVSWRAGDVLLLDNILAMHGRRSFRGTRRILAAMIRDRPPAAVQAMTRQRETAI